MVIIRGKKGVGEVAESIQGINDVGRRLDFGGEHTKQMIYYRIVHQKLI